MGGCREAVERGDLGFVLFDVVAERGYDLLGVLRGLLRRSREEHAVAGDHVDHLLAGLVDLIKSWRGPGCPPAARRLPLPTWQRRPAAVSRGLNITCLSARRWARIYSRNFSILAGLRTIWSRILLPDNGDTSLGRRRDASDTFSTLIFFVLLEWQRRLASDPGIQTSGGTPLPL